MSRLIEFKGFALNENGKEVIWLDDKEIKGEWVFGNYIKHLPYTPSAFEIDVEKAKEQYEKDTLHLVAQAEFSDWNMPRDIRLIKIIPETISQFTGLLDKNGKKIFENDIVKTYGSYELTVSWDDENAMFYAEYKGTKSGHEDDDNDDYAEAWDFIIFEVIGNKFDNPELLEKDERN